MRLFPTRGRCATAWLVCLALAATGLVGCTRSVAGSPVKPTASRSVDLKAALLDASEINSMMDTSDLEVIDENDAPDDTVDADPPECHGVIYISGETEYAPTDFTEMQWRLVASASAGTVVESLTQVPSAAKADEFIETQTKAWEGCQNEVIVATEKTGGATTEYRVGSVRSRPHILIAQTRVVSSELRCQHVLQAVKDVIVDVSACRNNVSDQAEQIADKLAGNIG